MFNKIKFLACSLEIHVYASVSKSAESCWHHCLMAQALFLFLADGIRSAGKSCAKIQKNNGCGKI